MDVFIGNVPPAANWTALKVFLKRPLQELDITSFDVLKTKGKSFAFLTVSTKAKGNSFLSLYGHGYSTRQLIFHGQVLNFRPGKSEPDKLAVAILQEEEAKQAVEAPRPPRVLPTEQLPYTLPFGSLSTGVWDFDNQGRLSFDGKYQDKRSGFVTFGRKGLVIFQEASRGHHSSQWRCRIDISYATIEHVVISDGNGLRGSMTFTLRSPPKVYKVCAADDDHHYTGKTATSGSNDISGIASQLERLGLKSAPKPPPLERLTSVQQSLTLNTGLCMVYRIAFYDTKTVRVAHSHIRKLPMLKLYTYKLGTIDRQASTIEFDFAKLQHSIGERVRQSPGFVFKVRFQLEALVREGSITPLNMIKLLPDVSRLTEEFGSLLTARAIRRLYQYIGTPSPNLPTKSFQTDKIAALLREIVEDSMQDEVLADMLNKEHLSLTYRSIVTPTGLLLRGPDHETSNRVLRKYADCADYFMRVSFADEDGLPVHFDGRANQESVYNRFRTILRDGLDIGGRTFEFLGFSHSSLRCHQCWFMAPFFTKNNELHRAKDVIADLGHFKEFRCSARCAARIGQAFTDTLYSITLPRSVEVCQIGDVMRGNRCFSDGCGSVSKELLQDIWRQLPRKSRPTTLQIRYQGAKGIVSLRPDLGGRKMYLRNSMIKFKTERHVRDIEICDAAYKPLRAFLNHQFIKILEDLGVPQANFKTLQNNAVEQLRLLLASPVNTASFLESSQCGAAARIPDLVTMLNHIGLTFQEDQFLTDIVEIAAMTSLRDLKYRARIPVLNGYLLFGLMDEWNILKEGEVYIHVDDRGNSGYKRRGPLIQDRVIVTRAPALHPGDIQLVKAVDVDEDSPLRALHNCIVFSQRGARDLPSKLSGGDLDGDRYHVLFEKLLLPDFTVPAADYPPTQPKDLGRAVETNDIIDHFIDFMKSDQLGQISTKHKVRSDKEPDGTLNNGCKKLAELASVAVDFSKSGNAVDMSQIPRGRDSIRPDFMAPSEQLVLDQGLLALASADSSSYDPEDDPVSVLNSEQPTYRYYRSGKVLGVLYRGINEHVFLQDMRKKLTTYRYNSHSKNLMKRIEDYIDRETALTLWTHHEEFAKDLLNMYKLNLREIMSTMRFHRNESLTELEVVSGNILGKKEQKESRFTREANNELRIRFRADVDFMITSIVNGHGGEQRDYETLPRAIACFKAAVQDTETDIHSWKYITAAVCLKELWIMNGETGNAFLRRDRWGDAFLFDM